MRRTVVWTVGDNRESERTSDWLLDLRGSTDRRTRSDEGAERYCAWQPRDRRHSHEYGSKSAGREGDTALAARVPTSRCLDRARPAWTRGWPARAGGAADHAAAGQQQRSRQVAGHSEREVSPPSRPPPPTWPQLIAAMNALSTGAHRGHRKECFALDNSCLIFRDSFSFGWMHGIISF